MVKTTARAPGCDGVAVEVGAHRARQHHARPVVVGEGERALDRAGRQHDLAGPEPSRGAGADRRKRPRPQPPPRAGRPDCDRSSRRPWSAAAGDLGQPGELGQRRLDPVERRRVLDREPFGQQSPTEARLLVDENHPRARPAGGERRGETGRAAADHQNVAMGVMLLVAVGIRLARRFAQPCGAADQVLIDPVQNDAGHLNVL